MVNKELINMVGKGRGVYYTLRMKRTISGQLKKIDMETLLLNIGAAKRVNSEIKPTNAGILFFGALGLFLGLMLKAISSLISRNREK